MKYFKKSDTYQSINEDNSSGKLKVYYSNQELPKTTEFTVFLAGPTYRSEENKKTPKSWRSEAVEYLKKKGFTGAVLIPEDSSGEFKNEYEDQIEWEEEGLRIADVILFWIPRDLVKLPGFTTNDEWGYWKGQAPEKLVLGCPKDAEKVRYQEFYAEKYNIPAFKTLENTLQYVIDKYKELLKKDKYTFKRTGAERFVPLDIWNSDTFIEWYKNQEKAGDELHDANVLWKYYVGPDKNILFLWSMWVKVWIKAEDRYKDNEIILSRFNLSSVVMYHIDQEDMWNSDIVLVKEFRSPVNNGDIYVYENPGGSSFSSKDPQEIIVKEIKEETGLTVEPYDLEFFGRRQLVSTLSIHKNALFGLELSDDDLADIKKSVKGKVFGVTEETERTYVEFKQLKDLFKDDIVDHAQIGMIMEVIYSKIKDQKIKV
jgi:8-oxo-dGTP pyrophosphatase MutT (NUDIX family)